MPRSYSISGLHVSLGDGSGSQNGTTAKRLILMALETYLNFRQRPTKHFLCRNERVPIYWNFENFVHLDLIYIFLLKVFK